MATVNRHSCSTPARHRRSESVVVCATCIGCGCTDDRACPGGCSWIVVDRKLQIGVCTRCHKHLDEFADRQETARQAAREKSAVKPAHSTPDATRAAGVE